MSFWDELKSVGSAKNSGFDIGGLASDIFGESKATKSLNFLVDLGSAGAVRDEKRAIEAEEMRIKRESQTNILNSSFTPKKIIPQTDKKKYLIIGGIVTVILLIVFKGGK
jgi:hypothetical protein